jgi:hypothetical protein
MNLPGNDLMGHNMLVGRVKALITESSDLEESDSSEWQESGHFSHISH